MPLEIEAKFRITDPSPIRQRLRELNARPAGHVLETNHMFDTPDGRLRAADCGLRIRICQPLGPDAGPATAPPALLTYKGPREPGAMKTREELETTVADPNGLMEILARLGFRKVLVYEKRRGLWHLGPCEITLDELPLLGWWLEIEGPNSAAVAEAQTQLGLAQSPPVHETYVEMAATRGRFAPDGCRLLTFCDSDTPTRG